MLATVCHVHRRIVPVGETCEECAAASATRRGRRNVALGRNSRNWRRTSAARKLFAGFRCEQCGRHEDELQPNERLTVDLIGGGDHSRAKVEDCACLCSTCHGSRDGGRR